MRKVFLILAVIFWALLVLIAGVFRASAMMFFFPCLIAGIAFTVLAVKNRRKYS